ncbi:hypothetical protein [Burkholderia cepacia]|uniref:hypothetical protein n=1 Tax=Burkholderia cepacia TaxID=292 RepID=UPI001CF3417F|nr:hypothetical protein [Burkholderia cepacia]MCA8328493.1 hypothetical protein [Burkholderia cepacia]
MTFDERLENWARAQRYGRGHVESAVAKIYFPNAGGRAIESSVDVADAHCVELAWRNLPYRQDKELLRMYYIHNMRPIVICRRLRIRVRPNSHFDEALAQARRAIQEKLRVDKRPIVSVREVLEKLTEGIARSDLVR